MQPHAVGLCAPPRAREACIPPHSRCAAPAYSHPPRHATALSCARSARCTKGRPCRSASTHSPWGRMGSPSPAPPHPPLHRRCPRAIPRRARGLAGHHPRRQLHPPARWSRRISSARTTSSPLGRRAARPSPPFSTPPAGRRPPPRPRIRRRPENIPPARHPRSPTSRRITGLCRRVAAPAPRMGGPAIPGHELRPLHQSAHAHRSPPHTPSRIPTRINSSPLTAPSANAGSKPPPPGGAAPPVAVPPRFPSGPPRAPAARW